MKLLYCTASLIFLLLFLKCTNRELASSGRLRNSVDTASGKLNYWLTTPDRSVLLEQQKALSFSETTDTGAAIVIDTTQQYQTMDGFGYTLTGGSAYVINRLSSGDRAKLLTELFDKKNNSIGISYLRLSIGASDLDSVVYSYDDLPAGQTDPALQHFSLAPSATDLIPLLKEIIAINPTIKILGTPWSPPVWMKDNGNSIGGSLKPEFYTVYAQYFVKYVQEMKKNGITIDAITPQNEPLHPGNNPSMLMQATEQRDFIKNNLGPAFATAGIASKIIVYDHNCNRPDYPITILNDAAAKAFVDGSAFHLYTGDISTLSIVHNAHPDRHVYFTEQYTPINSDFGGDLQWHFKNLVIGAPRNWARNVLEWNLANDASYGPHTPGGCTTCKGALTISDSGIIRNVAYYIIAHASKFVTPGSVRIKSSDISGISNVAFKTPEGKKVMIVLNEGTANASFNISINNKKAKATLPAGSVATFVW
jgi:glucosylceramidase